MICKISQLPSLHKTKYIILLGFSSSNFLNGSLNSGWKNSFPNSIYLQSIFLVSSFSEILPSIICNLVWIYRSSLVRLSMLLSFISILSASMPMVSSTRSCMLNTLVRLMKVEAVRFRML